MIGVVIALGQAPYSAFWLSFPAICLAVYMGLSASSARQAAGRGLLIGVGFGAVTFIWIVEPFLVDVARHGWMAPFALLAMAFGIGLFWAAAFWAARRGFPAGSAGLAVAIPVFWTGAELLRSYVLTGFPWGLTSYIWIDTPVYQLASLVGPHGLTLLTVLVASGLTVSVVSRRYPHTLFWVILGGLVWAAAVYMLNLPEDDTGKPGPIVRLIQPNASQKDKWDPAMMPVFFDRQLDLTSQPADRLPDLVIWPEVAVPFLLNDPAAPLWKISQAASGQPVVIGAQRLEGGRAFNSLALIGPGGVIEQQYDKHHLVPFGEYLPGAALLGRFGLKTLTAQFGNGFSAGPGPQVLDFGALGQVLPLICYEAIFPQELRRVATRPDWMLMVTNDAWFGRSAGPLQHLAQARARAIEMALPMVRAANTGVSAVIDARGRIVASMPLGVSGYLDVIVPRALPATLYWRLGDLPVGVALIVLLAMGLASKRRILFDRGPAHL